MEKPNPEKEKGKLPENYKHFKKPIPPLNSEELEAELGDVFNAAGEYLDKEKTEEDLKKDENLIWAINEENKNKKQGAIEQRQREEEARDQLAEQAKRDDEDDYEDEYDYESDSLEKAN